MIRKLQIRFIIASMLALTMVLLFILGGINLMSYRKIIQEADSILEVLSENGGRFPQRPDQDGRRKKNTHREAFPIREFISGREFSTETPFESRYFSIGLDSTGKVTDVDIRMIASVDQKTAEQWGESVYEAGKNHGFWEDYRYLMVSKTDGTDIFFLNISRSLSNFGVTLLASIVVSAGGLTAVLVLLILFSGRIVKPVAESYEKQKRFITDAGHEIKTPLTVIGADLDLAEMESGENEWLQDIRQQINRLADLTNDLITLSRMDEEQPMLQTSDFPISEAVEETARSFQCRAACQEKRIFMEIEPVLFMEGSEKDIQKLVSILMDNAVKYTPEGGNIALKLEQKGKSIQLSVSNTLQEKMAQQQLDQLFDRFYRADPARSNSGGYGLGLSIAKGIVSAHKGSIQASGNGDLLTIKVVLPLKH